MASSKLRLSTDWNTIEGTTQPTTGSSSAGTTTDLSGSTELTTLSTTSSSSSTLTTSRSGGTRSGSGRPSRTTNKVPTAYDAGVSTEENTPFTGQVPTAIDSDGTISAYRLVSSSWDASNGSLIFNTNGSYAFNPGSLFDRLAEGATTTVSFRYQAIDNQGAASSEKTVTITIRGTNDKPVCGVETIAARSCSEIGSHEQG